MLIAYVEREKEKEGKRSCDGSLETEILQLSLRK